MTLRTLRIFGFTLAVILFAVTMSNGGDVQALPDTPSDTMTLIEKVSHRIKEQVALVDKQKGFDCQGEPICGIQQIPIFYAERQFMPAWIDDGGLRPMGQDLIRAIEQAGLDGLQPQDYHLGAIHAMLK
ncbi:MAG: hypothetical protein HZB24_12300, partial [Desulfobacterales bacterium]|nr:hypothetical protein [Desulfobacterales bacterium]